MARAELPDVHINTGAQSSERASLLAIQCTVNIVWGDLTIQNVLTFLYPCAVSSIVGASFGAVLRHVLRFGQRWSRIVHVLHPYGSKWVGCLWYFRSCSMGSNRVGLVELVGFFTCSIMNQLFSVSGWFSWSTFSTHSEPGWKTMGIHRYHNRGLLSVRNVKRHLVWHGWSLVPTIPRNTAVFFNSVQPKMVEMRSIGTLQPHQRKPELSRSGELGPS